MDTATTRVPPAPRLDDRTTSTASASHGGQHRPRSLAEVRALLRDRLPELLATAGVALLVAAVTGFVVSQWRALDNLGQAGLLAAGSVTLTLQGRWAAGRDRRLVARLVPLCWGAAVALTLVAAQLLFELGLPSATRLATTAAGLLAAAHAGWAWRQRPSSILLQLVTVAATLYAVGAPTLAVAHGWTAMGLATWVLVPVEAIFGAVGDTTDAFAVVAVGHLLVAVAWIVTSLHLDDVTAARVGRVGGPLLVAWSALEFNAMASPIGASLALLVVIGFLVVGVAVRDGLLIGFGVMAGVVTGLRTLWSLFSGETVVTVTVAAAGTALVLAALRLGRSRDAGDDGDEGNDAPTATHDARSDRPGLAG